MLRRGWIDTVATVVRGKSRTPEAIRAYQSRQLKRLLKHAQTVPFYQRQFLRHNFNPSDFKGIEDLGEIPITTKKDFRSQSFEELVAPGFDKGKLIHYRTSGSTGQPMSVRISPTEELLLGVFRLRAYRRFGFRLPERMARIRDSGLATRSTLARLLFRSGIYVIDEISSSLSTGEVIKTLRRLQPNSLVTYPGTAYRIAKHMVQEDQEDLDFRWISIGGSTLRSGVREEIENKFGIRPFETYGSREVGIIAWECSYSGCMHINDDALIFEILKDGRQISSGQSGEVVVTALHSFAQPFIRFKLNDTVVKGPESCDCGLPYSSISSIQGRIYRCLKLPNGEVFSPNNIFKLIETELEWISQYQLYQESITEVVLRVVGEGKPTPESVYRFQRKCQAMLPGIQFRIEIVDDIPCDKNGKYRVVDTAVRSADIPDGPLIG